MRRLAFALFAAFAMACACSGAQVPAGFIPVTSTRLVDATGQPVASATVCAQAVAGTQPMSVNAGGLGNTTTPAVCVQATNGGWSMNLPDGALSRPLNATFSITATDDVSGASLLSGFSAVQPHSQTCTLVAGAVQCAPNGGTDWCSSNGCNFDLLQPSAPSNAVMVQGVPGKPGTPGQAGQPGPAGTTTYDGSNGPFAIGGSLTLKPTNSQFNQPANIDALNDITTSINKFGPGTNLTGLWTNSHILNGSTYNSTRGIKQGDYITVNSVGTGDLGNYRYCNTVAAGLLNGDDEAIVCLASYIQEFQNNFLANISSTSGTGDTQPGFTNVSGLWAPPDQGILLDLSKGSVSGTMTARSTTFKDFVQQMPLTVTTGGSSLPLTTAWGTATSALDFHTPENTYVTDTLTVSLGAIGSGTPAFTTGYARIADSFRTEMVQITAGAVTGNTQQVTLQCRYGHEGLLYLMQGGLAGQYMNWDYDQAFSGKYRPHAVLGSLDGTNVLFVDYMLGATNKNGEPLAGVEPADPTVPARAGYHMYFGAETVANLSAPGVSPVLSQVETNVVPWAAGDSVVGAATNWTGGAAAHLESNVYTPTSPSYGQQGLWISSSGSGISSSYAHIRISGANPDSFYRMGNGPLDKPGGIVFDGYTDNQPNRYLIGTTHPTDPVSIDPQAALLTVFNGFPNYSGTTFTGSTTTGSNIITLQNRSATVPSYSGLFKGDPVSGAGIPANAYLGQRQNATDWLVVDANGNALNATATSTTAQITVVAPRYSIMNTGFGTALYADGVIGGFRMNGNQAVEGKILANGGFDARNSYALVSDTFSNPAQKDTLPVNTESLQSIFSNYFVAPGAPTYTGTLQVVTGVSNNGSAVTTSTMHFTNGIVTTITTP